MFRWRCLIVVVTCCLLGSVIAQEKSINPGINAQFKNPNVKEFIGKFELESREVFAQRAEIIQACQVQPGITVADIGAGTGLFTKLFSEKVGKEGRVIAVDIAQSFLDHIERTSRAEGRLNVAVQKCTSDSAELPPDSIDLAFICDTYHHFEFPAKTMASVHRALKQGGRVILIDFRRIPGKTKEWTLKHVRAGQEVFEKEIEACGFQKTTEPKGLLEENYLVEFTKRGEPTPTTPKP